MKIDNESEVAGYNVWKNSHSIANFKAIAIKKVKSNDTLALKITKKLLINKIHTYENGLNREQ